MPIPVLALAYSYNFVCPLLVLAPDEKPCLHIGFKSLFLDCVVRANEHWLLVVVWCDVLFCLFPSSFLACGDVPVLLAGVAYCLSLSFSTLFLLARCRCHVVVALVLVPIASAVASKGACQRGAKSTFLFSCLFSSKHCYLCRKVVW